MKPKRFNTYTKKAVKWLLVIGVVNGSMPYILSAFGKEPCVEMGIAWITEVVAVILGYMTKSFKETKESENIRIKEKALEESEEMQG